MNLALYASSAKRLGRTLDSTLIKTSDAGVFAHHLLGISNYDQSDYSLPIKVGVKQVTRDIAQT